MSFRVSSCVGASTQGTPSRPPKLSIVRGSVVKYRRISDGRQLWGTVGSMRWRENLLTQTYTHGEWVLEVTNEEGTVTHVSENHVTESRWEGDSAQP